MASTCPYAMPDEGGIAGLRISADLKRAKIVLDKAKIPYSVHNEQLVIQAEDAAGVGLVLCDLGN